MLGFFFQPKKQFSSYVILGLRLVFSFQSKGNTTELSCISCQKMFHCFFFFLKILFFSVLLFAAKLGDTRELESFIDMLDRELAGAYLRKLHPLSLNLFFIPCTLMRTGQQAAVYYGGREAYRAHVLLHIEKQCAQCIVSTLYYPLFCLSLSTFYVQMPCLGTQVDYLHALQ